MKWTLLISDGIVQVNLEPESAHEREVAKILRAHKGTVEIHHGREITMCQGGYLREYDQDKEFIAITIKKSNGEGT